MKAFSLCIALMSFAFLPLEAAMHMELDSSNLLKCTFSYRHHNRIAIEGQRIKKIIYPEGDISIRIEEESGQIFVQAIVDDPAVTTLSIVTSNGIVQDLELSFEDKPCEILILREKLLEDEMCFGESDDTGCDDEINSIQNAIENMLLGNPPEEYVPVEDRQIYCRIKRGVTLKSTMRLIGPIYTIYVLTVENDGSRNECIYERDINGVGGEWVYLERNELARNDKILALIGVRTYEQQ